MYSVECPLLSLIYTVYVFVRVLCLCVFSNISSSALYMSEGPGSEMYLDVTDVFYMPLA